MKYQPIDQFGVNRIPTAPRARALWFALLIHVSEAIIAQIHKKTCSPATTC